MSQEEDRIKISFETNADQTKQSVDNLSNAVNNNTTAQKSLKQQIREASIELQNMVNKYGETSKQAIESAKAVAKLKDQMQFAQDLSKQFNPDQKFKSLGAATQLAGTGLQGLTSGMALFGDQSADTQKQLLKVQAAMAFSDAISNLSNLGDQWKLLKNTITNAAITTKANTAATGGAAIIQKAFTGAINTSSFSFKALKIAIASTGIGLLITGVASLVANFDSLKSIVFKAVPQLQAVGKTITGIVQSVTDFIGITSQTDRAIEKQKQWAEKSLAQNERYLQANEHKLTEAKKREIQLANEHFERVKNGTISFNQSLKRYNEERVKNEIDQAKEIIDKKEKIQKPQKEKEIKKVVDWNKIKLEKQKELQKELEDLEDDTEQKKLDRQKKRDLAEIEAMGLKGKAKQDLIDLQNKINEEKQKELEAKTEEERKEKAKSFLEQFKIEKEEKINYEDDLFNNQLEKDFEKATQKIEQEKEIKQLESDALGGTDEEKQQRKLDIDLFYNQKKEEEEKRFAEAKINLKKKENEALNQLGNQALGLSKDIFAKNKNIQKGIIIAEGGVALGKVAKNTVEAVSASISASPLTVGMPWSGIIGAKGVLDAATIVSSTQKALQALGTGGTISGQNNSSPRPVGISAQPQVGIQASNENQIATSIAQTQKEQPPIKAFVVSTEVSTAQVLDARLVSENSF